MIPHQFKCPHCYEELPAASKAYAMKRGAIHMLDKHRDKYPLSKGISSDEVERHITKLNPTIAKLRKRLAKILPETKSDQGRHVNYGWRITERTDHTAIVSILYPVPKRRYNYLSTKTLYAKLDVKSKRDFDIIYDTLKKDGFEVGLFLPGHDGDRAAGIWVKLEEMP